MAKVLFVKPKSFNTEIEQPPLELLQVAGYLKNNNHDVSLIDFSIERDNPNTYDFSAYEYVFIALYTLNRVAALDLAKKIKKSNKEAIIIGGTIICNDSHCTTMWKQTLENFNQIDICIIGEAEQATLEIVSGIALAEIDDIAYRENGEIVKTKPRTPEDDLDKFGLPAWELIDFSKYGGEVDKFGKIKPVFTPVRFSRGCIGACKYCALWWMWKKWRTRSAASMFEEIVMLHDKYGISNFDFRDDCFGVNREELIKFCDKLIAHNIKISFSVPTRVDVLNDGLVLKKMREAGCDRISYGVETGSQKMLDEFNKGITIETSKNTLALAKKLGYEIHALLIVGAPGETIETINETIDFLNEINPDSCSAIGGVLLLPGTVYNYSAVNAGYFSNDYWLSNRDLAIDYSQTSRFKMFVYCAAIRNRIKIKSIYDIYNFRNIFKYAIVQSINMLNLKGLIMGILKKVRADN